VGTSGSAFGTSEDATLKDELFRAALRVVAEVRQQHRSIFNLYFDDLGLRDAVIDEVASLRTAVSLDEFAKLLRAR
jgi:hypothetical protein